MKKTIVFTLALCASAPAFAGHPDASKSFQSAVSAPAPKMTVHGTLSDALWQPDPAKSWPAYVGLTLHYNMALVSASQDVIAKAALVPSEAGLESFKERVLEEYQGISNYVHHKCFPQKCWTEGLTMRSATVTGDRVDYVFMKFLSGKEQFPFCWIELKVSANSNRELIAASSEKRCTVRHED
jgi:hypothetical protein